jgi:hypothetical protein
MNPTTKSLQPADWAQKILNLASEVVSLAQEYCSALSGDHELRGRIIECGVPASVLDRMEAVGRGQIAPQLFYATGGAARRLLDCPRSIQDQALVNGLEVYEFGDVRRIPVDDLSPSQVRQVFARGKVRSPAEQRSWLESKRPQATAPEEWIIRGDCAVHQKTGLRISKRQMLLWLSEIK